MGKNYFKWTKLITKAMLWKKTEYRVSFTEEDDKRWYVDFPGWPLDHSHLMMVAGSDDLLDLLNDGSNHVTVDVKVSDTDIKAEGIKLINTKQALTKGAWYKVENMPNWHAGKTIWLCPVTLCVLGRYPKYMYFKKVKKNM